MRLRETERWVIRDVLTGEREGTMSAYVDEVGALRFDVRLDEQP